MQIIKRQICLRSSSGLRGILDVTGMDGLNIDVPCPLDIELYIHGLQGLFIIMSDVPRYHKGLGEKSVLGHYRHVWVNLTRQAPWICNSIISDLPHY